MAGSVTTIVTGLSKYPIGLSDHASARFSDGTLLVVYYDGTNLVYRTSTDDGSTWSAPSTITAVNTGVAGAQIQMDEVQAGDTFYGSVANYTGSSYSAVPFKLAYASGSVTTTVGSAIALTNFSPGTANPNAGGAQVSVTWDADHTLLHLGVQTTAGIQMYALSPSTLAVSFSLTGNTLGSAHNNAPIAYANGLVWVLTDNNTNSQVASLTVSGTAYGAAWSALTSLTGTGAQGHGAMGSLDTTQSPSQPIFAFSDNNGNFWVATYNGSSWTPTKVVGTGNCYGASISCVGNDLWAGYAAGNSSLVKRVNGTWGSPVVISSSGDRVTALGGARDYSGAVGVTFISANTPYTLYFYVEKYGASALSGAVSSSLSGTVQLGTNVSGAADLSSSLSSSLAATLKHQGAANLSGALSSSLAGGALRQGAADFAGTLSAGLTGTASQVTIHQGGGALSGALGATMSGGLLVPVSHPLPPPNKRGLQVLHAGQDISDYVFEDEEGSSLHDLVSGDGIALGGSSASGMSPTAFKVESTLAQGAGSSGAAGAQATFTAALGPATKAKGKAASLSGTDIVRQGEVIIKDATGSTVFGGHVTKLDDASEGINVRTVFNCVDYWMALDRIEVQQVYTGMGDTDILRNLCSTYAPWLDTSLVPSTQNYIFSLKVCKGTLREVLQSVANTTGFLIYVDVNKRLRYLSPASAEKATFSLSDTPDGVSSFGYALTKFEVDDNAIINRVYFYGGKNQSPDFTQDLSNQANGTNKVFMLAYPPEDASDGKKHITLNGTDLAVGSVFDTSTKGKFKSQGGDSDVLINAGSRIATFDVAPDPTVAGFTLSATYRYSTPLVVVLSSQTSYNFYGDWYDGRITDANVYDVQTAIQQCKLKLAQQAFGLVSLSLTTWTAGLQAGQLVRVVNSVRGINDTYLIQKVTANPMGAGQFSYDLELGAWNWNLLDLLVEGARILNPTDGYTEEDTSVIQAHETTDATSAVTVISHSTHASGQYYSGQSPTYSGFFTVKG